MDFGEAIKLLKEGKVVSRSSWMHGKFIFMQIPSKIPINIIAKMQSLPNAVKSEFLSRNAVFANSNFESITYVDQIAVVNYDNVITSYQATHTDIFAEDWKLYELD